MEMLGKILFIVVGIVAMSILLTLAHRFFKLKPIQEKIDIEGEKSFVLSLLAEYIYKCWNRYKGKKESIICAHLKINSTESINSEDIINVLDPKEIDSSKVKATYLGFSGEVLIRYENQNIHVEKVEYERIST